MAIDMFSLTTTLFTLYAVGKAQVLPPGTGTNSSDPLTNVTMAFTEAQVVPDVIPSFNPRVGVDLLFMDPSTTQPVQVVPDILLTMQQTQDPPQFSLSSNNTDLSMSNVSWVIAIVDPDAPTPQNPNVSQFLHFIGQDFVVDPTMSGTGVDVGNSTALMNTSQALVEFFPPTPPAGSDPHRYVVLVYVQPDDFNTTAPSFLNGTSGTDESFRMNFNITAFAANTSLGDPVAGNFFLVGPGPGNTTTPSSSIIPSGTLPFPSPSATSVLPLTTASLSLPPAASSPAATDGSAITSGVEKTISQAHLVGLGVLSVALGLLV